MKPLGVKNTPFTLKPVVRASRVVSERNVVLEETESPKATEQIVLVSEQVGQMFEAAVLNRLVANDEHRFAVERD